MLSWSPWLTEDIASDRQQLKAWYGANRAPQPSHPCTPGFILIQTKTPPGRQQNTQLTGCPEPVGVCQWSPTYVCHDREHNQFTAFQQARERNMGQKPPRSPGKHRVMLRCPVLSVVFDIPFFLKVSQVEQTDQRLEIPERGQSTIMAHPKSSPCASSRAGVKQQGLWR